MRKGGCRLTTQGPPDRERPAEADVCPLVTGPQASASRRHLKIRLLGSFCVLQRAEIAPRQVQDFFAERSIEALDEGVLIRIARLDVLKFHCVRLGPIGEFGAQKLRAVVDPRSGR